MNNFKIIIDGDIFTSDLSTSVVTTFFVDINGNSFPFYNWTDFANPVLNMWTYALLKNKDLSDANFPLYFMEGPFRMDVLKDKNMQLTIDCINARGDKEILEYTITCNYYDLLADLYDAIKSFNYMLYSNGMNIGRFAPVYNQTIISMKEIKEVIKRRENTR